LIDEEHLTLGTPTLALNDTGLDAGDLLDLIDYFGPINVANALTLSGDDEEVLDALNAPAGEITGFNHPAIGIDNPEVQVTTPNAIDARTNGLINAAGISDLTGPVEQLQQAYDSLGISGLGDEDMLLTDDEAAATALNALDAETTSGTINADTV